jgi:multicomponent Na+:H+ antiporter subunit D
MSGHLAIVPILWPFATAVLMLLLFRRNLPAQRVVSVVSVLGLIALEVVLFMRLDTGEIMVYRVGNWPAPFGIVLMLDRLSGIMLLLASVSGLAALVYGLRDLDEQTERHHFYPLYCFLLMGINGSFVTGDLFNMFVWYEVMLIASYSLLVLGGDRRQLQVGISYVALNLVSSAFFLVAASMLYGVAGTLNMADLSVKLAGLEGQHATMAQVAAVALLCVFGIKAAIFPMFFWLPDSYPQPPVAISTMFAGIMTKVGVYSMLRVFALSFSCDTGKWLALDLVLPLAGFTMIVGVLGAICQMNFRRLLSFHIISQVGFMVMGIGLFTPLGIAGGVVYIIHHIMVKGGLFLVAGVSERAAGHKEIDRMGGFVEHMPWLSALFFIAGASLAGLPPLSGFFAKFVVIKAGFDAHQYGVVAASLVASFLTLFSMMKIWQYAFWHRRAVPKPSQPRTLYLPVMLLVSFSLLIPVLAQPLYRVGRDAAAQLTDQQLYIKAVMGPSNIRVDPAGAADGQEAH